MLLQRSMQSDALGEIAAGWYVLRFHRVRPTRRGVVCGPVESISPNMARVPVRWAGASEQKPEPLIFTTRPSSKTGSAVLVGDDRAMLMFAPKRRPPGSSPG